MLTARQIYDVLKGRTLHISNSKAEQITARSLSFADSELYLSVEPHIADILKETPTIEISAESESGKIMALSATANFACHIDRFHLFMLKEMIIAKNEIWEEFSPFTHFGIVDIIDAKKDYAVFEAGENFSDVLEKYHCINVPDDALNDWGNALEDMDTFHHCLNRSAKNLARYGVTLIPPQSVDIFKDVICKFTTRPYVFFMSDLFPMFETAKHESKYIIHFGI